MIPDITNYVNMLSDIFFRKLQRKTGWGRKEIMMEFESSVSEASLKMLEEMTIEESLGLHTRVEIIDVVDGYEASLIREDETTVNTGSGDSILTALLDLEEKLK